MREDLHTNWAWMWGEITAGLLSRQMRRWGDIIKEHGTETPSFAALCWWPFEECLPTVWQIHLNERQFGALSSRADQSPLLGRPEETCGRPPLPRARPFPRRHSDLPTASLRAAPLCNGSCPALCFWAYRLTSGAGAPASEHGGVQLGAGQPGSQVAAAGLGPVLHPKKSVRSPVQVFAVQKSKARRTVGFKASLSGNRVGFWAREAICNVPVSHHGCVSLHKVPYVSRDWGRVFLALKNAIENVGNIPIFSLALSFVPPVTAKQSVPPWRSAVWRKRERVALSRDLMGSQLTHCHLQHCSCWEVPAHQHPEAMQPFDFKSEHW